ncbi:ion transporter [Planococcus salinus]|uniref:Ion transporter n=2 Tax=Planococcus salinus TaxID=1848460 RepID=A0A3M8P466_9BACL|nr:ion transporter [Planococcus salinus]
MALGISTIVLLILSALVLPWIEPETFPDVLTALWYTTTAVLSVGFGDVVPQTLGGKLYTMIVLYGFGIGLIASLIGKAFDSIGLFRKHRERGDLVYEGKDHIIIIDWSHKAINAIKEIFSKDENVEVVIIDNIEKTQIVDDRIHYVKGDATDDKVLTKANILKCKAVLIFADDGIHDQMLTDGKSLIIATTVERMAPNVHITVEVEREEHVQNFKHIQVDNFILSDATIAKLAVGSILK